MLISYLTHPAGLETSTGFGYAGFNIVTSLQGLGHRVLFDEPESPIQFMFTQPQDYAWSNNQYSIGYTPWESTKLHDGWQEQMASVSEQWCTSELNKQWFENLGLSPTKVYPHGITHNWSPRKRKRGRSIRFLQVGGPAVRKHSQLIFDVFQELYKGDMDYTLTIKSNGPSEVRYDPKVPGVLGRPELFPNVSVISENLTEAQMVSLYHSHDILLYASAGEGFGFIPLQGLATGMPVVFNTSWAPYKKFSMGLDVDDFLKPSPWGYEHPGDVFGIDRASLKRQIVNAVENFDHFADKAYEQSHNIHFEYDWTRQTYKAFQPLFKRFSKD